MKKEIKELRKIQKYSWNLMYPGYPFAECVVIDLNKVDENAYEPEGKIWLSWYNKKPVRLSKGLEQLESKILYQTLGFKGATKGSFIIDPHIDSYKKILKANYDDFYIDNDYAAKFYMSLVSAIRTYMHKGAIIIGIIDMDSDFVDVKVFHGKNKWKEINNYTTLMTQE